MPVEIKMPELGESVHEGTVSRWLKQVGDFVKEDEPVVEIMTDKVNTELAAPASGILSEIVIPEGSNVEVFHVMGIIDDSGGTATSVPAAKQEQPKASAPAPTPTVQSAPTTYNGDRQWFTPVVRAMAKENGLSEADLAKI